MSHIEAYCVTFDRFFMVGEPAEDAIECKVVQLDTSTLHAPRLILQVKGGYIWSVPFDRCVLVKKKGAA